MGMRRVVPGASSVLERSCRGLDPTWESGLLFFMFRGPIRAQPYITCFGAN